MSSETPRAEMTQTDGFSLVNSCSVAVDLRGEIPAFDVDDGISQCHVTTSLFDDAAPGEGKSPESETLKITSQGVRASPEVKKTSKSDLTSGGSRQRKIKVAVVVVACLLLLTSFILVGVTLSMSSHIDDMVRKTYEPPSIHATTKNQQRTNKHDNNNNNNNNNNGNSNDTLLHHRRHQQQQQQQQQQRLTTISQ